MFQCFILFIFSFKPPATPTAHELKLKRKKAYKLKRRHTDVSYLPYTTFISYVETIDCQDRAIIFGLLL